MKYKATLEIVMNSGVKHEVIITGEDKEENATVVKLSQDIVTAIVGSNTNPNIPQFRPFRVLHGVGVTYIDITKIESILVMNIEPMVDLNKDSESNENITK